MAPIDPGTATTPLPQTSNGPWIVTSVWALTGAASFFVLLRFYCRLFRGRIFAVDDWLLLVAWVSRTALLFPCTLPFPRC